MTYFRDLSAYEYDVPDSCRPETRNIGWLGKGHDFPKMKPAAETLDLVWAFCKVSVAQMRGRHTCEFCPQYYEDAERNGEKYGDAERNGEKLQLGSSEIRVFSPAGNIYAAPTLIYHYMAVHHYSPPEEFVRAMHEGPKPPSKEYFGQLNQLGLEWIENFTPQASKPRTKGVSIGLIWILRFTFEPCLKDRNGPARKIYGG